jgi:pyrimidine deaminase RibD-like protein
VVDARCRIIGKGTHRDRGKDKAEFMRISIENERETACRIKEARRKVKVAR